MKTILSIMLCILISICAAAQKDKAPINEPDYNKPRLFDNLPEKITITADQLNILLNSPVGKSASLSSPDKREQSFEGEIVSEVSRDIEKSQSVVMRLTNFNGANLTVTRILQEDNTYKYIGRIISFKHGDLYELKTDESGNLALIKRNYYELINE